MKRISLLALSLVMVLSLAACGGDRGTGTNGSTTNGTSNGTAGNHTNGTTNGTVGGTTNGAAGSGVTGNGTTGGSNAGDNSTGTQGGTGQDIIGSDLDDMVQNGIADDKDGNLNREP